jgi:hypothetical protein
MTVKVDAAIAVYLKLREQKAQIEKAAKAEVEKLERDMDKLTSWLKIQADETGVASFKTPAGTAFLKATDYASVADWDAVVKFVKENDAYDMLTKGVSKVAIREYMNETKELPPGVNFGTKIEVQVRKPTNKED